MENKNDNLEEVKNEERNKIYEINSEGGLNSPHLYEKGATSFND